eukprot:COSAG06_NODE_6144_length_3087_cov_14.947122_5_plen_78_part_00
MRIPYQQWDGDRTDIAHVEVNLRMHVVHIIHEGCLRSCLKVCPEPVLVNALLSHNTCKSTDKRLLKLEGLVVSVSSG